MKAKQAVVCPKCGALSRPNGEFCARCNESLEGAAPAEGLAPPAEEGGPPASSVPANAIALVAVVVLGLLGVAAWRYASQAPPRAQPDPSLFTIATRPSELPSPAPATAGEAADYEAGRRRMNSGDLPGAVARLVAAVAAEPQLLEARQALAGANQSIQDLRRGRAPSSSGGY